MRALLLLLLSFCLVAGCAAPVVDTSEDVGESKQALNSCWILSYSIADQGVVGAPGMRVFYWKAMNLGTASCPYKTRVDVTLANGVTLQGTTFNGGPLAPYSGSGPLQSHSQTLPVGTGCVYRIMYAFKPNYPSGSESWAADGGNYPC